MARRAAAKPRRPRLQDETADRTLRRLLAAQLAIVRTREPTARRGSVEALHDVRVALRRMRSLTTTFAKLEPKFLADLDDRLSRTCDRMGDARDLDVWIELFRDLAASGGAAELSGRDQRRILAAWRRRRTQLAAEALACGPFRRTKKMLREFLRGRPPRRADPPPAPAACAARRILKMRELVAKRYARVGNFSKGPAHDLRRAGRRLRYLSEFFAADLGRECVRAGRWITKAQAALGKVHDCDNALELSRELPAGRAGTAVRRHLRKRRAAQLRKFKAAWRRYADRRLQKAWQTRLEAWAGK
jgi:CHAD domain-containing protein